MRRHLLPPTAANVLQTTTACGGQGMKLLRRSLRVVAIGAVAVAVGVAVNQVLNGGRWNLWRLVAAAAS